MLMTPLLDISTILTDWQFWGTLMAALALLLTFVSFLISRRRKMITYRVLTVAPLTDPLAPVDVEVHYKNKLVQNVKILVIRIWNSGHRQILPSHYVLPLTLSFQRGKVISADLFDTQPATLPDFIDPNDKARGKNVTLNPQSIALPNFPLEPKNEYYVKVLLEGSIDARQIRGTGTIAGGSIVAYNTSYPRLTRRTLGIVMGILVIVLVAGISIGTYAASNLQRTPGYCVAGSIKVSGSSALAPLATRVAQQYQQDCPQAHIQVIANTSTSGLADVNAGNVDIGASDVLAKPTQVLVDHPVAVVIYGVVVNTPGVNNLTMQQIQQIYNGTITNWKEVDGHDCDPDCTITVISRVSTSGTRKTFEHFVLNGPDDLPLGKYHREIDKSDEAANAIKTTPGAIGYLDIANATRVSLSPITIAKDAMHKPVAALPGLVQSNDYTFWSIEHLYTKGTPAPDSLISAYLSYMSRDTTKNVITTLQFVNIGAMPEEALSAHIKVEAAAQATAP